jgi:hypothetical protein
MKMLVDKRFIVWFSVWFALACVFAIGLGSLNWIRYYRLVKRGIPTGGLVTSQPDPHNHGYSTYSYTVGSQAFTTTGYPQAAEGQTITVFYLAYDPAVNCPGDPRELLKGETAPIGMASLLFPTLIVGSAYWRMSRWRAASRGSQ